MFTPSERAALERAGATVTLVRVYGDDLRHIQRAFSEGDFYVYCRTEGFPSSREVLRVSLSDLRRGFMPDLCPTCREALGLEALHAAGGRV